MMNDVLDHCGDASLLSGVAEGDETCNDPFPILEEDTEEL